jgi:alkanesulfonate monooxygenase SsuD/methylene tetrahydromethanopterin reductase-like flavin-dependent oxidoreductase (luciferase family)
MIGGGGEKTTLRLVAQYADAWNITGSAEVVAQKSAVLQEHCQRAGRDPRTIHRTGVLLVNVEDSRTGGGLADGRGWVVIHRSSDLVAAVTPYAEAGVDELIVHFNPALPLPRRKELLTEFMGQVAPAFAGAVPG